MKKITLPDGSWIYEDDETTDEEWCEDNRIIPPTNPEDMEGDPDE